MPKIFVKVEQLTKMLERSVRLIVYNVQVSFPNNQHLRAWHADVA